MPISDYRIVRGHDAVDLQNKVREALAEGWDLLGAPLIDGRGLMQAMTLEGAHPTAELFSDSTDPKNVEAALALVKLVGDTAAASLEGIGAVGVGTAAPVPDEPAPKAAKASKPAAAKE